MQEEPSSIARSPHDNDEPTTTEERSASAITTPGPTTNTFNLNHTPSESSFLPAQAAVSSTPAGRAQAHAANNSTFFPSSEQSTTTTADPTWSALVESPLVRLNRELHEFTRVDPQPTSISNTLSTPTRTPRINYNNDDEDDEDPTLPAGMSPPVTIPFARLGRSPAKSAAMHIRHALLREAGNNSNSSASASAPTPPSLSRYTRAASASLASLPEDPEFDSLMRRVSLLPTTTPLPPPPPATLVNDDASVSFSSSTSTSSSGEDDSVHNTAHPSAAFLLASRQRGRDDNDDDDEEDDSLDADLDAATASFEPVHPFARVVAAGAEDDSFDSLDGDEPEETVFGARPVKRGSLLPLGT